MIASPHDKYFKNLFQEIERVTDFIQSALPHVAQHLDLKTLTIDNTSYIDKKLFPSFSDMVYNCTYKNKIQIKIALLFEHKSYIETVPQLQLLGYMLKIWETNIKQKNKLMPVIPILFYHGKEEWEKKPFESHFEGIDDFLRKYLPTFEYELINTNSFTDEQINNMFQALSLKMSMLVMKHIFDDPEKLMNELHNLFSGLETLIESESGRVFFETTVIYLLNSTKMETEMLKERVGEISQNAINIVETGAMKLKRDERKSIAISMLKDGFNFNIIAKHTKLSLEEIEKIAKYIEEIELEIT